MITSNQISNLCEEYAGLYHGFSTEEPFVIYKNPTSSDVHELVKTATKNHRKIDFIRIILDAKNKVVYVADSYCVTHQHICGLLNLPYPLSSDPNAIGWVYSGAQAIIDGDRLRIAKWSMNRFSKAQSNYNWEFASRYLDGWSDALNSGRWSY